MSTEPQYSLNNFSNLNIVDDWALSYYAQAAVLLYMVGII